MAVKIKDVAEKAGVSVTTVSRVLNGGKYVKDELKQKVQNAIDELEYTPSYIARSLVLKKTNLIGVIVPNITSSMNSVMLSKIEETASKNNYIILVCDMDESLDKQFKYLNVFKEMRVDGIIITNEKLDDRTRMLLKRINIPIVFASVDPVNQEYTSIIVDNEQAAYDAVKYLIELEHEKIAFIGGDMRDITSGVDRYKGFKRGMNENNLQVYDSFVKFGDYTLHSGYRLMKEILETDLIPTAVFAASDDMAVGAINCILDNGLKVPDDISVIGFDGTKVREIVRPQLTSMEQPINEIGTMAVDILIQRIDNKEIEPREIILKHKLDERKSCKVNR